jgi:protein involved in polysaccharide export with SLBB domain
MSKKGIFACVLAVLPLLSACQSFRKHHFHHHHGDAAQTTPETVVSTVDIGGDVTNPARLIFGEEGLTLRRALVLAGGAREQVSRQVAASRTIPAELREWQRLDEEDGEVFAKMQILKMPIGIRPSIANNWVLADLEARHAELQSRITNLRSQLGGTLGFSEEMLNLISGESRSLGGSRVDLLVAEASTDQAAIAQANETFLKSERTVATLLTKLPEEQPQLLIPQTRTLLAAIQRSEPDGRVTYFVPYESAMTEMTGDILLRDHDLVQVIDYRLTSLNPLRTAAETGGVSFTVGGLVQNPGTFEIREALTIGRLAFVADPLVANVPGVAWTLRRQSPSGLGEEVFIIPTSGPAVSEQILGAPTLGGDVFTYLTMPQIPLIFESIARQVLQEPLAQRLNPRRVADLRASAAGQLPEGPVAALAQETGLGSRLMRNAHEAHTTMRNRLDLHHLGR